MIEVIIHIVILTLNIYPIIIKFRKNIHRYFK